jgi:MFS family permease
MVEVVRQYYLLLVLQRCGVSMTLAAYPTFLLDKGLNLLEMNLVNVVFFVTMFVCEIPTGAFADVFGRKQSFIVSCALYALAMLTYAFSTVFWQFTIAEILAAAATTFFSGAFDAWLVDKLKHRGHEGNLSPVFARASQFGTLAGLVAALAGSVLYDYSHALPWIVSAIFFALNCILAYATMKEEYFVREPLSVKAGWQALKDTVRASIEYGVKNKNVRFVMLLVLALNFTVMAPNMQWQPLFKQWLTNQTSVGFLWTGMALTLMAGAWIAPRLLKLADERKALLVCQIGTAVGILATVSFASFAPTLVLFLAHEIGRGAFGPIKSAYLHDNIPSKERATVVSFESISHHVGGAAGLVVSGAVAQYGSIPLAWTVSGGTLLAVAILLWRNDR